MPSITGTILGSVLVGAAFSKFEQPEQPEQFQQSEQPEQYEQYEQPEQYEQSEQSEQFLRVASDWRAFSLLPQ
jgi:L-lactate permease